MFWDAGFAGVHSIELYMFLTVLWDTGSSSIHCILCLNLIIFISVFYTGLCQIIVAAGRLACIFNLEKL